jgi:hypothetical protein
MRYAKAPGFQRTSLIEHSKATPELEMDFLPQVPPLLSVRFVPCGQPV